MFLDKFREDGAGRAVQKGFQALNDCGVDYCVQRNYQGYPQQLTGDIDLVVRQSDLKLAVDILKSACSSEGWTEYFTVLRSYAAHLGLCSDRDNERMVLVWELFPGGPWRPVYYLSAEQVLASRRQFGEFWIPRPEHELIVTVVHHLLWNRCVPEKYRQRAQELISMAPTEFDHALEPAVGLQLAHRVRHEIEVGNWKAVEASARPLLMSLNLRALLRNPISYTAGWHETIKRASKTPAGVGIVLRGHNPDLQHRVAKALLVVADRWHVFLPTKRIVNEIDNVGDISTAVLKQHRLAIRRGGVSILIDMREEESRGIPFAESSYTVNMETPDDINIALCNQPELREPVRSWCGKADVTPAERISLSIWKHVLNHRAKLCNIARGS